MTIDRSAKWSRANKVTDINLCASVTFAELLNNYLSRRFSRLKTNVCLGHSPCTVCADSSQYRLYFRVKSNFAVGWTCDTLVIANCSFPKSNHYEELLDLLLFIAAVAPKVGYGHIGFEAMGNQIFESLQQLGMTPYGIDGNYRVSVEAIQAALKLSLLKN